MTFSRAACHNSYFKVGETPEPSRKKSWEQIQLRDVDCIIGNDGGRHSLAPGRVKSRNSGGLYFGGRRVPHRTRIQPQPRLHHREGH